MLSKSWSIQLLSRLPRASILKDTSTSTTITPITSILKSPLTSSIRAFHFPTTHVGSLPRPPPVLAAYADDPDSSPPTEVLEQAVIDTVKRQVELGITVVGDGEMSKPSYVSYVSQRLTGFGGSALGPGVSDLADFPEFAKQQIEIGAVIPRGSDYIKCCNGPIQYKDFKAVKEDTRILTKALQSHKPLDGAFLTAASPGVVALFQVNKHFDSHEKYIEALVPELAKEYAKIVEAGFYLQLDCPDLAMGRHHAYSKLSEEEFLRIAAVNVAAINAATEGLPQEKLRLHLCWGNWHGPHHHDIPIEKIFKIVMGARPSLLLFESANPRHAHEVDVFKALKDNIPQEKVLVPGVIDSTTNFIEHPALVARRLLEFSSIVGKERVQAGSDCGFATFGKHPTVHPDIVWAKLGSMVEGAKLAASRVD